MENGSGTGILSKKFLLLVLVVTISLVLSSCVLIKDNTKPLISNFTKSATLLSQHLITFKANVIDTGSGLENVVFEIDNSPLPTTKEGSSLFVANWFGVYGSYEVTVLAQDRAGNLATKTDKFFVMDSTPPVVEVSAPSEVGKGMNFPIKVVAYDMQSGVKNIAIEIDGEKVHTSSKAFEWSFSQTGIHTVSVTAVNGQGLITTKNIEVKVINASKVPPYLQVIKCPQTLESGKTATMIVYAYSPNGVKSVNIKIASRFEKAKSKGNLYIFRILLNSDKNSLLTATYTVRDYFGKKRSITRQIFLLSKHATAGVLFPSLGRIIEGKVSKIPFFIGEKNGKANFAVYVDGIPVDVEGNFPKFFALWKGKSGKHVLTVLLDGKTLGKKEFFCDKEIKVKNQVKNGKIGFK